MMVSVEGVRSTKYEAFSVQFHPEASPGPEDSNHLFDRFIELMKTKQPKGEIQCLNVKILKQF